ncbi:MAG: SH3 domain-containing protein [Thermoanaerobaculia bacterium]
MAAKTGVVTANALNLREEPSTGSSLVRTLARGTRLKILETAGAWYKVQAGDQNGYVHGDFVRIVDTDHAAGFLNKRDDLGRVPLEPSEAGKIPIRASFNGTQKLAVQAWNIQGGLLQALNEIVEVWTPRPPSPCSASSRAGAASAMTAG